MNKLDTKGMTEYLKYAMELEASVYSQERALAEERSFLNKTVPVEHTTTFRKPKRKTVKKPSKPQIDGAAEEFKNKRKEYTVKGIIGAAFTVLGAAGELGGLLNKAGFLTFLGVCGIIAGIVMLAIGIKNGKNYSLTEQKRLEMKNADKLKKYEADMKKYEREKEKAEQKYQEEIKEAEIKYAERTEKAKEKYKVEKNNHMVATKAVDGMEKTFKETKSALKKLYDLDVVFPKYRNLVAISTMYEYFASGRVSELEGPDGAYNLYEAELRQNLIINKLDVIITNLESIKANQFSLYMELKTIDKTLKDISGDVSKIVESTKLIAENTSEIAYTSSITAACAQVTAKNSEALKYIALVNG